MITYSIYVLCSSKFPSRMQRKKSDSTRVCLCSFVLQLLNNKRTCDWNFVGLTSRCNNFTILKSEVVLRINQSFKIIFSQDSRHTQRVRPSSIDLYGKKSCQGRKSAKRAYAFCVSTVLWARLLELEMSGSTLFRNPARLELNFKAQEPELYANWNQYA